MDAKGAPSPQPPPANPNPNRLALPGASAAAGSDSGAPSKPMLAVYFLRALSRIRGVTPVRRRTRTIRRAAYSSMARAASPRRAWSRALLLQARARRSRAAAASSRRAAVLVRRRVVAGATPETTARSSRATAAGGETSLAAAARAPPPPRQAGEPSRTDALRRLVPGGAGMEYCSLLEETADYVRCLRAQVQLMQGLADLFSCQ